MGPPCDRRSVQPYPLRCTCPNKGYPGALFGETLRHVKPPSNTRKMNYTTASMSVHGRCGGPACILLANHLKR